MSEVRNGEIHIDEEDASGGEKSGVMRWVLAISLIAAVVVMGIIAMTGAFSQDETESSAQYDPATEGAGSAVGEVDSSVVADEGDASFGSDDTVENGVPVTENN